MFSIKKIYLVLLSLITLLTLSSCSWGGSDTKPATDTKSPATTSTSSGTSASGNVVKAPAPTPEVPCDIEKCGIKDSNLTAFLVKKEIKSALKVGNKIIIKDPELAGASSASPEELAQKSKSRFNSLLAFDNYPDIKEGTIYDPISEVTYQFDKTYVIKKALAKPKDIDVIYNYINTLRIISICADPGFKGIDECLKQKNIFLNKSATWETFKKDQKLEENIKSIMADQTKKGQILQNLNKKIGELQQANLPIEKSEQVGKSIFDVLN